MMRETTLINHYVDFNKANKGRKGKRSEKEYLDYCLEQQNLICARESVGLHNVELLAVELNRMRTSLFHISI